MIEQYLRKLIGFKTTANNLKEMKLALLYIKSQIRSLPVEIHDYTFNKIPSLVITTQDTKHPTLWLQAHLDVVSGSDKVFQPTVKGSKMYGRGAYDMKFAIACYMQLLKDLRKELHALDFGVMITCDEEMGGEHGSKALLDFGYRSDVCFLPDGGEEWAIEQAAKGIMRFKVTCQGKAVHGAKPWEGKNAIEELLRFLYDLKQKIPDVIEGVKDHYHNTSNVGTIHGGIAVNVVPDYAESYAEIRFTHESSRRDIENILDEVSGKYKNIKYEAMYFRDSTSIDPNNAFIQSYQKVLKEKYKKDVSFTKSHGASDASFFTEVGIPTLLIRPKGGGHHSEEEWIDLKSLDQFYEVLKEYTLEISKYSGMRKFRALKVLRSIFRFLLRR